MWEYIEDYDHNNQYTDDRIFDINKEDKTITKIKGQPLIAGERNSQYIAFQMSRYYDGIDLSKKDIKVLYVTELGFSDINKVMNVKVDDNLMQFGWLVPPGASAKPGLLSFCVEFTGDDYVLKTIPTELEVIDSMNGSEISSEPIEEEWYAEIQTLCNATKELAAGFMNNTLQFVSVIDMTEYKGKNSLALSVVDENKEWVANTELFPEYGIYKLINAKSKIVCGGGSVPKSNAKIQLTNDTVYINYQQNTVDIYDDKHYTVYHIYNNTGTSEQWTDFFHITDLEIDEKIANAIPFVNKPDNSNQVKVIDGDFDSGAINRIVFPCTLYDYADHPLISLKINDLVSVSYDDWSIGYVQVITKEGIYNFKMCAGVDEETGDYIDNEPLSLSDCILPTMGEVKQKLEKEWVLLISDNLPQEVATNTKYSWSTDKNGNSYKIKELFAEIVFPSELSENLALQINGTDASAIMWGLLPAKTKKVHIHSKMLPNGCIETEYVYKLSSDSEITAHKSLKGINGERKLTAFTKLSISSRATNGSVALPSGTAVKIWAMQ